MNTNERYEEEDNTYQYLKDMHQSYFADWKFIKMLDAFTTFLKIEKFTNIFSLKKNEIPKYFKQFVKYMNRDKKDRPQKPEILVSENCYELSSWICPCCNTVYGISDKVESCTTCGQIIDWSERDD